MCNQSLTWTKKPNSGLSTNLGLGLVYVNSANNCLTI